MIPDDLAQALAFELAVAVSTNRLLPSVGDEIVLDGSDPVRVTRTLIDAAYEIVRSKTTPLPSREPRYALIDRRARVKKPKRGKAGKIPRGAIQAHGVCTRCGGSAGDCRCVHNAARHVRRSKGRDEDPVIENVIKELEESGDAHEETRL